MINSPPQIQARQILDIVYPVGIVLEFTNGTNPNDIMQGQTWERIYNVFLYASGSKSLGAQGGEENHTLSVAETPAHRHGLSTCNTNQYNDDYDWVKPLGNNAGGGAKASGVIAECCAWNGPATRYVDGYSQAKDGHVMSSVGGSKAHNNMPPYLVVNMWKRTA